MGELEIIIVLLVLLMFVGPLVISYFVSQHHKRRIEQYLSSIGATDIRISRVWFTLDRDTNTYEVEYFLQGQPRRTFCKIHSRLLSDRDIYWKDPPTDLPYP